MHRDIRIIGPEGLRHQHGENPSIKRTLPSQVDPSVVPEHLSHALRQGAFEIRPTTPGTAKTPPVEPHVMGTLIRGFLNPAKLFRRL